MKKNLSLNLHKKLSGKIEVNSKISINSRELLSQIYTPGVAEAVSAILKNRDILQKLTIRGNTVAVVTDGSAVLGFGNIGPEAALPVMEGKCILFKEFAGLNAFPICLGTQDTNEIINCVKNISPVFAAINLEDISAPKCFEIERGLQNIGIPVMHDDQHATAIIVLAGLINAARASEKDLKKSRIVINGTGAAGTAITRLLNFYGCNNMICVDSRGIIGKHRIDLSDYKKEVSAIINKIKIQGSLADACTNADILIGVSQKGLFSSKIIKSMNAKPIVFALANPDPEITRTKAKKAGAFIYASGRSDEPNQINNALVFPGFFRGLIKNNIRKINDEMKVRTANAICSLIKNPTPSKIVPDIFNKDLVRVIEKSLSY